MSKGAIFVETYFPPRGSVPSSDAGVWFPTHLLMGQISSCNASGCSQPTAYVFAGTPTDPVTPVCAVCDSHICEFAAIVNEHTACPKCHYQWVRPAP